ncbi:MAG: glutamate--tRNA ligase [Desulfobacteraceae bacterium 4572_130]|nr:MAG: glutamate--tRNA ligase [Desulfobacteraceae bacterium 4572_130]
MNTVITRFPPSPTGYLHIGGARTALFNWLYAKKTKGKFILRIEDTDSIRSTKKSTQAIFDSLKWLGIDWDEGPYFQTQRYDIYQKYIKKLVNNGHAYYCQCSHEQVNAMRKKAKAQGQRPMYNGKCRRKNLENAKDMVVRFKTPETGVTIVEDAVKGTTLFQNKEMDDFIIQRGDNTPTYNLAVVVDDITMGINTIIRGDDHLINTPKQILLYKAFGNNLPLFAHVPMVLGHDKSRLSKRHGAMSVTEYRNMGYLPDAMINYLVRLGWSFGDQEFFTRQDLIKKFSLKNIGKSPSMFDKDKLTAEMAQSALFYFQEQVQYDEKIAKKFLIPKNLEILKKSGDFIENLNEFTKENLEHGFKNIMEETNLKFGKIAQPVRVALTGKTTSPGIFEMILILGKEKTIKRIYQAMEHIKLS